MHPHRKQGRVAAVLGRPVFYASLPAEGGSVTHAHAHISFFVGTFIDIIDSPAAHTDPNLVGTSQNSPTLQKCLFQYFGAQYVANKNTHTHLKNHAILNTT